MSPTQTLVEKAALVEEVRDLAQVLAAVDALPIDQQLAAAARVVSAATTLQANLSSNKLRLQNEYLILLRDAAGLPPRLKRDAKWLERFAV